MDSIERERVASTRRRRWPARVALGLVLLGIAGGGAYWWRSRTPAATAPAQTARRGDQGPIPVGVATAARADVPVILNALGTVTPLATVTLRTQISGQLTEVAFREGQDVAKGDYLAQIDPRPYQNQLDQSLGQLARDQSLLRNAETDMKRYRQLVAQDSIARQQLDTQTALVQQYQGTVQTDQALVATARLNLAYCRIVSPIDGRIGLRQIDQGNYVTPGDANGLVVITQLHPISARFTLAEDDLPAVMEKLRAGAKLEVTAFDRAGVKKLGTGVLATVDNQIDPTTGTVKLKAEFANEDLGLFPNQFVTTRLLVDQLKDATTVPTAAIQRGQPGTFVYVVGADETVSIRPVKLGPVDGAKVAIRSGVEVGERVVVDGADRLRDGMKVAVPDPAAAPPAGDGKPRDGKPKRAKTGEAPKGAP